MLMRLHLLFLLVALVSPNTLAQTEKVLPVDETNRDPSLFLFRLRMIEAVATRDTSFIYDHLYKDVYNSFGGEGGVDEFKTMWQPWETESELWSTLATILGGGGNYNSESSVLLGGGAVSTASFRTPYWSSTFPAQKYDAFNYGVVVGEEVRVRVEPNKSAAVLATLSHDIVRVLDFFPSINQPEHDIPDGWVQVQIPEDQVGYIAEQYVGSAVGWRAIFHKIDGRWLITSLVAGD